MSRPKSTPENEIYLRNKKCQTQLDSIEEAALEEMRKKFKKSRSEMMRILLTSKAHI